MIPVWNTYIDVTHVVPGEGYADATETLAASAVHAVISEGSGSRSHQPEIVANAASHKLTCDPTAIFPGDKVYDRTSGVTYTVLWSTPHSGPSPIAHTSAGLSVDTYG